MKAKNFNNAETLKNLIVKNNKNVCMSNFEIKGNDDFEELSFDCYCTEDDNYYNCSFTICKDDGMIFQSAYLCGDWCYEKGRYFEEYDYFEDNLEDNIKDCSTGWYTILCDHVECWNSYKEC